MDIIDVDDVLGDDSFIGDTERLDDEVEEILKQWKSSSTFPSSDGATTSSSSNSVVPTAGPAAASASNSFGFGSSSTNHHHHQHLYGNSSSSSGGNGYANNNSFNSGSKGLKYIDTRTFTRPKKKLDSTFNASSNVSAELVPGTHHEHTVKMSSPLLNLQIGGPVTLSPTPTSANSSASHLMQKSWLNDVSPPGSIMSSMEFSVNEKLGSSLITSGDFTNVSYLLNGANGVSGGDESALNSHSSYDGYRLADVIKDRKFLENLSSCFDENTMTKDCAISRTDLNGIEEGSGFSTMQSSLESVTAKGGITSSGDATMVLESGKADATFELEPVAVAPAAVVRERLNGTFERRRNFDTYRKPKSSLNSTFDALPKVDADEPIPVINKTFDAGADGDNLLDATFGVAADNCNGTFSLNRTAKVNGGVEKQLNQTYEYCEKASPAVADRTFEAQRNGTFVEDVGSPANRTPNGTFELPVEDRLGEALELVQSTPFVQVPRAKRVSGISEYEVNCSPIAVAPRLSQAVRRSRNLEQDMAASVSHLETDDFDVEFRKLPITPNAKTESGGSHLLDNNEKRISLQHFEEFEKSIMESEHNGLDFDEMLNSLTSDVRRATDSSVKLRQSLDNIKKRHSRINTEKQQQEEHRKRGTTELNDSTTPTTASPLDSKLADSMIRSMSSSGGSERLLNRRSRYNDDVHLTLSPQQQLQKSVTEQQQEVETNESNPAPTAPEVGGSDKKNRDRFKTIRISKRREEGMVVVDPDDDDGFAAAESAALPVEEELPGSPQVVPIASAFGRVDYNSPKESRLAAEQNKTETEAAVFKRPQLVGGIPKAESKIRSLSKPRSYYGATPSAGGFGLRPKDLSLPLSAKSSSTDNLENDRPNYQQPPPPGRLSLGGKLGGSGGVGLNSRGPAVQSNLKSPMGTKSKSHHNLYFNQSGSSLGGSNSSLHRIPAGSLGLSAQKLSHNNSNTELSGVQMRAPKAGGVAAASRLGGLVRPSSGYFSYSSSHKKIVDSDTESINSLSSSSASSRGSLYRVDSQTIANNVQTGGGGGGHGTAPSVEDISFGLKASLIEPNRTTGLKAPTATAPKPSGLRPPSQLRPPTARSGLPRPTSYVRR
ncbi:uncharacterized protein LOC6033538 isoform X2 [Culex quinquefasciatus]|uniref:uncharacterized protein LOC6033538 isoform X2 n=1 Tax=Culex quinquefasciatus TaxID=7176 RepID=UPI0018E31CC0|nr:uncharacterized protein LOC6033538 isoform X2 [Culex quinquefasciatus]